MRGFERFAVAVANGDRDGPARGAHIAKVRRSIGVVRGESDDAGAVVVVKRGDGKGAITLRANEGHIVHPRGATLAPLGAETRPPGRLGSGAHWR